MRDSKCAGWGIALMMLVGVVSFALAPNASATGLIITPTFDASITGNPNAAQIEGAINTAINTMEGLFSNSVTIPVTFTYNPGAPGNLESTTQLYYDTNYSTYVSLLQADSTANPANTVLATALANLSKGNDSSGSKDLAVAGSLLAMLGVSSTPANAVINIASNQPFAFSGPVPSNQFDAIGGIEHELDEVLGGGGAGSTLNSVAGSCVSTPSGFFCNKVGPTDLYRYSAANTPSFTTSGSATAYLSVDGGVTSIVQFNQNSNGDYGDFTPAGAGAGQLIQNAFNSTGQDEAYTSGSPEFMMLEAVGWNASPAAVPEPGTLILLGTGLTLAAYKRRKLARRQREFVS
jgi:hypothetical protein